MMMTKVKEEKEDPEQGENFILYTKGSVNYEWETY